MSKLGMVTFGQLILEPMAADVIVVARLWICSKILAAFMSALLVTSLEKTVN